MRELSAPKCRVDRDQHGPEPRRRQPEIDTLEPILAEQRNAIAARDAGLGQLRRVPGRRVAGPSEGSAPLRRTDENAVAVRLRLELEQRRDRAPSGREAPERRRRQSYHGGSSFMSLVY